MAKTRQEFQQLARMRLRDARVLLRSGNSEAAYYLTGFAVECAVKACIAKNTGRHDFPPDPMAIKDIYTHKLTKLVGAARLDAALETERRRNPSFNNKWDVVKDWDNNSRYEVRDLTRETCIKR